MLVFQKEQEERNVCVVLDVLIDIAERDLNSGSEFCKPIIEENECFDDIKLLTDSVNNDISEKSAKVNVLS